MKHILLVCFLGFFTSVYSQNVQILLTPPDTVYIQVYSAYQEPGYSATSPNGDITDSVQISTNLDTSTLGIYPIEYFVTDTGGNILDLQIRIVYVIDTIPPYLVLIGDSIVKLALNESWIDPGITTTDDYDINPSLDTITTFSGTQTKGCFYICYFITDQSGNTSKPATRIIEVDNGCTTYDFSVCSNPTSSIQETRLLKGVKIYPNPASKEVTVKGIADYKEVWMEFFDLEGKILARAEITGRAKVSVPECLAAGTYILRITADGKTLVKRQVIE